MRVMWICNIPIMRIKKSVESKAFGGWMTSLAKILVKQPGIELSICYPQNKRKSFERDKYQGIQYFGFYVQNRIIYQENLIAELEEIERLVLPDIIHIFGTEFPHTLSALKLKSDRTLVSIQGLIGVYAEHYFTGIPSSLTSPAPYIFAGRCSNPIYHEMIELKKRGRYEREALKRAKYITGRTEWDYACVKNINPRAQYFKCNEILRDSFYEKRWNYESCKKHSIFISQADYPVKGFHIFLKALNILQKKYEDLEVVVAGTPLEFARPAGGSYAYYIKDLIARYKLKKIIRFVGLQDEYQMCNRYLKTNVFVLPSLIENSPNSLGEAMLMGVPCVVANVGGINSLLEHEREGFLYQVDAEYMLAYYIEKVFECRSIAEEISANARRRAEKTHDREKNIHTLLNIYSQIIKEGYELK